MGSLGGNMTPTSFQRSDGIATILGLGTAVPANEVDQSTFPDYYFKVTNSEHMTELKKKFSRMCEKSAIEKRYMCLTDEILRANPDITAYRAPSLDIRQELMDVEVPRLAAEASRKAIKDWGRPIADITHLVFCCTGGASLPGADYELIKLLDLPLSTKRFMLYQQGCHGGGTILRLAKDVAENNPGARILVVTSEVTLSGFRGPCETHPENLVTQALFADGAGAVIVGADPRPNVERPIFELVWTSENIVEDSGGAIVGKMREVGLVFNLHPKIPSYVSGAIDKLVGRALKPLGISDWNEVFWVMHTGGRAIIDAVEKKLGLREEKLEATREVLRDYGNMWSACVFFVMEAMRRRSSERSLSTPGEGLEWGLLFGFGPGLSVETIVLRCPSTA